MYLVDAATYAVLIVVGSVCSGSRCCPARPRQRLGRRSRSSRARGSSRGRRIVWMLMSLDLAATLFGAYRVVLPGAGPATCCTSGRRATACCRRPPPPGRCSRRTPSSASSQRSRRLGRVLLVLDGRVRRARSSSWHSQRRVPARAGRGAAARRLRRDGHDDPARGGPARDAGRAARAGLVDLPDVLAGRPGAGGHGHGRCGRSATRPRCPRSSAGGSARGGLCSGVPGSPQRGPPLPGVEASEERAPGAT